MTTPLQLQFRRLEQGAIRARASHALREVTVLQPALCYVRLGEKHLCWQGRAETADARHLILLPVGASLTLENRAGTQGYLAEIVVLPPALLQQFSSLYGAGLPAPTAAASQLVRPMCEHIATAWQQLAASLHDNAPPLLQHHAALGVLLALALQQDIGVLLRDRRAPIVQRVQQLIQTNLSQPWTVEGVAEQLHLGGSTLRRQLEQAGHPFRALLEDLRMNVALGLLQTTRHPVAEVANRAGYLDAGKFSRRFQAHFGMSPRELRSTL